MKPPKPHQIQTKTSRLVHKNKSAFAQSAKVAHWAKALVVKLGDWVQSLEPAHWKENLLLLSCFLTSLLHTHTLKRKWRRQNGIHSRISPFAHRFSPESSFGFYNGIYKKNGIRHFQDRSQHTSVVTDIILHRLRNMVHTSLCFGKWWCLVFVVCSSLMANV